MRLFSTVKTRLDHCGRLVFVPVVFVYMAIVYWTVIHHEPWADEAQAWLIARDSNVWHLMTNLLRYEGTPALWHLLLMIPAKLGIPYGIINYLSASIASLGVILLVWKSPLPKILNLLLPFTFFIVFQYAVVARNYAFLPVSLFVVALAYRLRMDKPYILAGSLFLLANVSVHSTLIAVSLMALHVGKVSRSWRDLHQTVKKQHLVAVLLFFVGILFVALQLIKPYDLSFPAGQAISISKALTTLNNALTGFWPMTVLVLLTSVVWFKRAGVLAEFLIPLVALLTLFAVVYVNDWHEGTVFLLWVFVLWRSFDEIAHKGASCPTDKKLAAVMIAMASLVCLIHIYWAFCTVSWDLKYPYSGSQATARYLKDNKLDSGPLSAFGFCTTGILPYFDHNIFTNRDNLHGSSFWFWSTRQRVELYLGGASPNGLVYAIKTDEEQGALPWDDPDFVPFFTPKKYIYSRYFDGEMFLKNYIKQFDAFAVMVRNDLLPAADLVLPRVQYQLGMMSLEEKRYEKALDHFQRALQTGLELPRVRFAMAYCFYAMKSIDRGKAFVDVPECKSSKGLAALRDTMYRIAQFDPAGSLTFQDWLVNMNAR